jgi:hypothetical protein
MHDALEHLASLHPTYLFGRLTHRQSGLAADSQEESWDSHDRRAPEVEAGESTDMIEAAAAAAALAVFFFAVMTAIAGFTLDAPDPSQHAVAAISDPAVVR